jgi:hypothetical protein
LAQAKAEAEAAEQAYVAAFEKGDSVAMGKAQRQIANAEARAVRLDEARADLEYRKKQAPTEAQDVRRAEPRQAATDPVEAYLEGRSDPAKKWLRNNPQFITDGRKNAKLTAAHYSALGEGITADSPEYFEHVESFVGLKSNGANGGQPQPKKRPSVPVAPVHQSSGGTNGGSREVRLTPGEARAAQDGTHVWNYDDSSPQKRFRKGDPIGIQEFARRKEALTKQGAYDRSYTES